MGGNSGDNWDLIGDIPGERGKLPDTPGYEIEDTGALMTRIKYVLRRGRGRVGREPPHALGRPELRLQ